MGRHAQRSSSGSMIDLTNSRASLATGLKRLSAVCCGATATCSCTASRWHPPICQMLCHLARASLFSCLEPESALLCI